MNARKLVAVALVASLAACDDFDTGTVAYREGRFDDAHAAFAAAVAAAGDDAPGELLYDEALAALRAGDLKDADAAAERAATRDPELRPLADFVRGNVAFARCELAAKQAEGLEAEPFAFDVAIVRGRDAARRWQSAAMSRADWPEARRNVERALRKLEDLRDRQAQAAKSPKNKTEGGADRLNGVKPDEKSDAAPPPPPPPPGGGNADDPSEQSDPPQLTELPRDQVMRLFEKLAEKERERLAGRHRAAKSKPPEVERDW
jgi:tetratricopeptide (TPR) repeat protein